MENQGLKMINKKINNKNNNKIIKRKIKMINQMKK